MRVQLVFNIWESRAFIAKAILKHPDVKHYLKTGNIAIGRGITNSYILREFLWCTGNTEFEIDIDNYVAGVIDGTLWISDSETRTPEVVFRNGKPFFEPIAESVESCDLVLKGGNALGTDWIAGVLCAHPKGGTIGSVYATCISRGIKMIVPISIEKMVPFPISDIVPNLGGQKNIDYARGLPCSLFPIVGGEIFSEIDAIDLIGAVEVYPIGAGGVYEGAGSTVFEISGIDTEVQKVLDVFEQIKGTKPMKVNLKQH
ncbi:MAG: hypothetical protein KAT16_00790 [Candidatus Heimdallarchaeota archaeon]|nr:hypothetical protein [Candidatus Heimdallarchaeota archaeon]